MSATETMKTRTIGLLAGAAVVVTAVALLVLPSTEAATRISSAPRAFFGIAPQTPLTEEDARYMRAGGIGSVRWPLAWSGVEPTPNQGYDWGGFDDVVATAARQRLRVLPFLYATPEWAADEFTTLPTASAHQRSRWRAFLRAAVERYGPGGEFWTEHGAGTAEPLPEIPLREWQIWNEVNFFYFAYPVSVSRYARLLRDSSREIKAVDPGATIVLSGLFGEPNPRGKWGMDAVDFLERLYRVRGIESSFDAIALHPYAVDAETLAEQVEGMRAVSLENEDPEAGFYLTELGWGSEENFEEVAFEQGIQGQVRQLRDSYAYLLRNRHRLNMKSAYWFTWKDIEGSCSFCDSTGFFHVGDHFHPKPAWRAFVRITRGRALP